MKEATYVAISTQKGGAGKTTLTVLVASYLHYVKGYNVAVVDCDFPQYSIHDMRKRDMKAVMEDGHYKVLAYEQLKRLKKNPYTIRCSRAEDAVKTAENLVAAQPDLDFVFFDLPGTINNADVVQTISQMDYIFTPIIADRVVMESSIKFATVINEQMISTGKSGIKWKSHSTLTLLATQDLPTFLYYMIDPLKSWCWGAILFYPFKNSRFS